MSNWYKINPNRGKPLLVVDNYIHRIDRNNKNVEYYKCFDNYVGRATSKITNDCNNFENSNHVTHGAELARRGFRM